MEPAERILLFAHQMLFSGLRSSPTFLGENKIKVVLFVTFAPHKKILKLHLIARTSNRAVARLLNLRGNIYTFVGTIVYSHIRKNNRFQKNQSGIEQSMKMHPK